MICVLSAQSFYVYVHTVRSCNYVLHFDVFDMMDMYMYA